MLKPIVPPMSVSLRDPATGDVYLGIYTATAFDPERYEVIVDGVEPGFLETVAACVYKWAGIGTGIPHTRNARFALHDGKPTTRIGYVIDRKSLIAIRKRVLK